MPKLKIRRGGFVDDILPPLVSCTMPVLEIIIPHVLEAMVSISSTAPLVPGITERVPSVLPPIGTLSPLENFRPPDKWKAVVDGEGETATLERGTKGNRDVGDSQRARQGQEAHFQGAEGHVSHDRGAS
ncbi:hypothetical protein Fot_35351 [Forsythia ovata]|uniref:Uncharacterized protein n=1 Tax=Forsythia ovata TaxID=205694 RepID=A0ABD1SP25_9LAMI